MPCDEIKLWCQELTNRTMIRPHLRQKNCVTNVLQIRQQLKKGNKRTVTFLKLKNTFYVSF